MWKRKYTQDNCAVLWKSKPHDSTSCRAQFQRSRMNRDYYRWRRLLKFKFKLRFIIGKKGDFQHGMVVDDRFFSSENVDWGRKLQCPHRHEKRTWQRHTEKPRGRFKTRTEATVLTGPLVNKVSSACLFKPKKIDINKNIPKWKQPLSFHLRQCCVITLLATVCYCCWKRACLACLSPIAPSS